METIEFKGEKYPSWQAIGNAAQWIMPLALHVIGKGKTGLDIGSNRREWAYPNAMCIDPELNEWHAMDIPVEQQDFIFSSHMLEHLNGNWMNCIDYWLSKIKDGGTLFLYLPHSSQLYWLPENNRKHVHSFNGTEIRDYLRSLGYDPYLTPVDYNNSFAVICEKKQMRSNNIVDFINANEYIVSPASVENYDATNYWRRYNDLNELSLSEYNQYFS